LHGKSPIPRKIHGRIFLGQAYAGLEGAAERRIAERSGVMEAKGGTAVTRGMDGRVSQGMDGRAPLSTVQKRKKM